MTITDTTITTVQTLQGTLSALTALSLTDWHFPSSVTLNDGDVFDFVVIGSGAGGSTMASRLTEDGETTVALIEAGGIPPLESVLTGLFTVVPNSGNDWNFTSTVSTIANKYLQNQVVGMTSGKMLGGSSGLDHAIKVLPSKYDMDRFVTATGDDDFSFENMLQYFTKSESVRAEDIIAAYPSYHGTDGPLIVTTEPSDLNTNILAALQELGIKSIVDVNPDTPLGCNEPQFLISDMFRQSAAESFLGIAKNRSNLYVQLNALATKIIIDDSNVATGVQILTSDGTYKTINARKEVIVSCGAIKSPQLLMLSGIGNKTHLAEFDIDTKVELPVGDNLMDHLSCLLGFSLTDTNTTVVSNPSNFPVPMTTAYVSLDGTEEATYQTINLYFTKGHSGLPQLCVWVFKYNNTICEPLYNANVDKDMMLTVMNIMKPKSNGTVRLSSSDPSDSPIIDLGHMTNDDDRIVLGESLYNFSALLNTTYFQSIGASIVDFELPECADYELYSNDYFTCYGQQLSATMWHYSSTLPIGTVTNSDMTVKGVTNLRVVDASVLPYTVTGNIITTVYALAEKAAAHVKSDWDLS